MKTICERNERRKKNSKSKLKERKKVVMNEGQKKKWNLRRNMRMKTLKEKNVKGNKEGNFKEEKKEWKVRRKGKRKMCVKEE